MAVALIVPVREVACNTLNAALEARLNNTSKSPEELAEELAKHADRTARLRQAHLDAVCLFVLCRGARWVGSSRASPHAT